MKKQELQLVLAGFVGALGCTATLSAVGATHAVQASVIDLTAFISQGLDLVSTVLTAIAGYVAYGAVSWFSSKTKLHDVQMEQLLAQRLNDAILYGINLASATAKQKLAEGDGVKIAIDNPFISIAASYVLNSVPDTLNYFGWTADKLKQAVITRAEQYLGGTVAQASTTAAVVAAQGADAAAS